MTMPAHISPGIEGCRARKYRVLIVDKDPVAGKALETDLKQWGYETDLALDIKDVRGITKRRMPPSLFIIDCAMSPSECSNTCHVIRTSNPVTRTYIIILTPDIGPERTPYGPGPYADDYIKKPYNKEELHIRIKIAMRVLGLQDALSTHICDLEQSADKMEKLHGLLSICTHCKKVRDDRGRWNDLERYISTYSDAQFSHAICPDCLKKYYPDAANEL